MENIETLQHFLQTLAYTNQPISGDKAIRKFIQDFAKRYEESYGPESKWLAHLKEYTWYPTSVLMKYVREMIRSKNIPVRMHKVTKQDEYWFEYYVPEKKRGAIKIVNDPRKNHPELRGPINDTVKSIQKRNPSWDITLTFAKNKPYEFIVTMDPKALMKGVTVDES